MAGLLDFINTPAGMGLLSAAAGYASGARRGSPVNNIGRGLLGGLVGYGQAQEQQTQLAQQAKANELRDMQLAQLRQGVADQQARREVLPTLFKPGTSPGAFVPSVDGHGPTMPPEMGKAPSFDTAGAIQSGLFKPEEVKHYADLFKPREPEYKVVGDALVRIGTEPQEVYRAPPKPEAAPSSVREYEFARSQGYNGSFNDWTIAQKRAGASSTNLSVNTDKSYFGQVAEGLAKNDVATIEAARSAPERITSAQRVREVLDRNPITGTAAETRLAFNKAFATAGLIDGKNVADTETLASMLANQTLDAIKTSGLGSGQGFTDKDRQFLERAKSGNIEMTGETLRRLADLNERSARDTIKRGNSVIGKLRTSPQAGTMGQQLEPIAEPKTTQARTVVRQGKYQGRTVRQYSDGSMEYAD